MKNLLPVEHIPRNLRRRGGRGRSSELFPDLNISAVAEAVPCNPSHLFNMLHGERFGTVRMLQRVAVVLRLPLVDLLKIQAEAARLRAERQDDIESVAV